MLSSLFLAPINTSRGRFGCPECGKEVDRKKQTHDFSEFISKASRKFGGKFTYKCEKHLGQENSIIEITCPIHGTFKQKARCTYSHKMVAPSAEN